MSFFCVCVQATTLEGDGTISAQGGSAAEDYVPMSTVASFTTTPIPTTVAGSNNTNSTGRVVLHGRAGRSCLMLMSVI